MRQELIRIAIRVIGTLIVTPIMGYLLLGTAEIVEKAWKTNNRRKKWLAMCGVFFILAGIGGWFR